MIYREAPPVRVIHTVSHETKELGYAQLARHGNAAPKCGNPRLPIPEEAVRLLGTLGRSPGPFQSLAAKQAASRVGRNSHVEVRGSSNPPMASDGSKSSLKLRYRREPRWLSHPRNP